MIVVRPATVDAADRSAAVWLTNNKPLMLKYLNRRSHGPAMNIQLLAQLPLRWESLTSAIHAVFDPLADQGLNIAHLDFGRRRFAI